MDYDDDGILDFISGSYDPGNIYLFRGAGDGRYEAVEEILDTSGLPVVHHPAEYANWLKLKEDPDADDDEEIHARVASFGSWVAPVDWDADGDLDLLIGSFGGELFRRVNEGTRGEPAWGTESIPVEADGEPIKVYAHADPVVADWNSDGLWDLVISSGDGSVGWYENVGAPGAPRFGPRRLLVAAASETKFLEQNLRPGEDPVPGVRAQVCVTDYNGDGLLDLILGDYSDINITRELTREEQTAYQKLVEREHELGGAIEDIRTKMQADDADDLAKEENEEEYRRLVDTFMEVYEQRRGYYADSRRASFIWLYLRTRVDDQAGGNGATGTSSTEPGGAEDADGPVSIRAGIAAAERARRFTLSVEFEIEEGWHINARMPDGSPSDAVRFELSLPDGVEAPGEWRRPDGTVSFDNPLVRVYEETVTFEHDLELTSRDDGQVVSVDVSCQVCNDRLCLPTTKVTRSVSFPSP